MRKLLLAALFSASVFGASAQKIEDVKADLGSKKYTDAQAKIDKIAADPKNANNSEVWFYKSVVYDNLSKANPSDANLQATALDAMKHYFQIESGVKDDTKRFLLSTLEGHKTAFDLYSSAFNAGVKSYQAKNYEESFRNFQTALQAFDMLSANKLTNVSFDTTSVLYAGITAQNSKNFDNAAKYYSMLADRKIADPNYVDLYEFLVQYYNNKKDEANAAKYLALGEQLYPSNKNWVAYEIQSAGDDKVKRRAKYEELMKKYPKNYEVALDYTADLFSETYGGDPKKPGDPVYETQKQNLTQAIDNLISINPTAGAYYIQTQHLSNQIYDLETAANAIKGTKPEDLQKKKSYNAQISTLFDQLFASSTKAYDLYDKQASLKPDEKQNFKKVVNDLIDYYQYKKQPAKVTEYQNKLKSLS
jgi:hypothetical protein